MKVLLILLLLCVGHVPITAVIGTTFICNSFADEHFPFLGEISHGPVNVRAGANTNFEAVDKLAKGAEVVVLAKNYEWYKVQLPLTASTFVRADYIKERGNSIGELTGDKVNLRVKANSESSPLGQLNKGDLVKLVEKTGEWWKIEPPAAGFAWIHADFVKVKSAEVAQALRKPLSAAAPCFSQKSF